MIKGWTADNTYYFDPVYGTMAKGTRTIDGVEYVFDEGTGLRVSGEVPSETKKGFEAYGIQCNVKEDEWYEYKTIASENTDAEVVGKAKFTCETYTSRDGYETKEGYVWKDLKAELRFFDENTLAYGVQWSWIRSNYYEFTNDSLTSNDKNGEQKTLTVQYNGKEYEIQVEQYGYSEWIDDIVCAELGYWCHVPEGYDGVALILYNPANAANGDTTLDRLDEDSLVFRLQ